MATKNKKIEVVLSAKSSGFTSSVAKATKGLSLFHREIDVSMRAAKQLDRGLTGMVGKFSALFGGISTAAFGKSIWDAGVAMQSLERGFKAITGSADKAGKEMEFLRQTSNDLGLNFRSSADAYKQLAAAARGTTLEGKETREIFLGISEASTVLGLTADNTKGALKAISQMMSKGNVQAEELRGQLGERLPGAFQLAAKAMGVTTKQLDKMLKNGQVTATDLIPKLSQALHDLYGKAAVDQADGAIQALNRFQNAWFDLKAGIAESGFLDVATGRIKDFTNAMNDPATKQRIVELSTSFFKLADAVLQFTINHGEAMAKVAAGTIALSALSRAVFLLTGAWRGLNAATLVITGSSLLPYLKTLRDSLSMTQIASLGLSGALGAAAGSTLALMAGFKAGEWLYKWTEPAEQALVKLQNELDKTAAKYRQFAYFKPESTETLFSKSEKDLQRYKEQLVGAYRYQGAIVNSLYAQSRDTTIWGNATKESRRAGVELVAAREKLKTIERAMDDYASAAENAHKKAAASASKSADTQSQVTGKALAEMKKQYKQYADQVKRIQDEIAGRERSLVEQLRAMSRTGMSDLGAWKDRKLEAQEYEAAARKAAEAGNLAEAVKLADQAKTAYADLNKEVKSGDTVLISSQQALKESMSGVKSSGELAIDILKKQKEAAKKAADALNEKSGFQMGEAFTEAGKQAKELADLSSGFEDDWRTAFVNMGKDAAAQIDAIDRNLNDMVKNRDVYIRLHEVQARATGGPIHRFADGGKLPGYGGGDRVPALLEAGEYIIRKEAVNRFGAGIFHALNNLRLPDIPRFATGGPVGGSGSGESVTINFSFPGEQVQPRGSFSRSDADSMVRIMKRQHRLRSS